MTLESDKATMDVPAPKAGTVREILAKIGDKVAMGSLILRWRRPAAPPRRRPDPPRPPPPPRRQRPPPRRPRLRRRSRAPASAGEGRRPRPCRFLRRQRRTGGAPSGARTRSRSERPYAAPARRAASPARTSRRRSPAVRGVGPAARACRKFPVVDFAKFGPVETKPLSRIKRISGPRLHASWVNIPHVTHSDDADITELDAFRKSLDDDAKADKKAPYRVSLLPLLMKATVAR